MDLAEIVFTDDTRYAYAVGRIRALETRLLTRADFARLLDAADYAQTLRVLGELGYPLSEEAREYEPVLMAEQKSALDLLGQLSEDDRLTELFRRRYDYHNLKVLLKAKYLRQELDQAILDLGMVPVEMLAEAVMGEEGRNLPESLARAMAAAEAAYAESQLPADLDVAVEREQYAFMARGIWATGNSFLKAWLAREVDFLNIKTFFRLHWLGENLKTIDRVLMQGGDLGAGFFRDIREEPLDTLGQVFAKTPYGKTVAEAIGQLKAQNSFAVLERNFDDLMIQLLKRSSQASFGAEPLVAYLLLKEFEIRAVRAVLVGKLNQLPKEKIKERLPSEYI